jgi:hypothetical protein
VDSFNVNHVLSEAGLKSPYIWKALFSSVSSGAKGRRVFLERDKRNLLQADILVQPIRRRVQHKFQHLVKLVNIQRKAPETLS